MTAKWRVIQENAIHSWAELGPRPEILLIGDEPGVAQMAHRYGCRHIPQVERNRWGTPLLGSVFEIARQEATHEQLCYVNADIILMQDFIDALKQVILSMDRFLIIAATWGLSGPVDFATGWQAQLRKRARQLEPTGIDTFAFTRGACDLNFPPMAIGRYGWDAWLPYKVQSSGIPVVDVTASAMVLHQDHEKIGRESDEVYYNLGLANVGRGHSDGYVWSADWYLDTSGLHAQSSRVLSTWRRRNHWLRHGAITLFSTPCAHKKPYATPQENAIASWTRLLPRPEIVLCSADEGVEALAAKYSCTYCPDTECNEYGTPVVSSVFEHAQALASNDILCYVNTDIILMQDFVDALSIVSGALEQFLMIGQRWDTLVSGHIRWKPDWAERLRAMAKEQGEQHAECGIDYFAFHRGLYDDLPPYILGRYWWDNGLVLHALQLAPVVDASQDVVAIHQHHQHLSRGGAEELSNHNLYQKVRQDSRLGHITDSTHTLANGILKKRQP